MKRLSTILAILLLTAMSFAQVPQQFSFQALIRDAENEIVSNRVITVQISIVTANGNAVYSETHQTATNENGVVSLAIGTGTTTDNFSQIDWSKGEYYLKTVADLGADEQLVSGTSPLLSVPYALYAEKAGNASEADLTDYAKKTDLDDYAKISDIPQKVSDLTNDVNYVTMSEVAQPDLSDYYSKAEVATLLANLRSELAAGGNSQQGNNTFENGVIKAAFSVSANKQVYFSQGNLQYQASTSMWRFAEHQYDIIGDDNSKISSSYSGWIDLFGWGTSGYNNKFPYMTSKTQSDYGNGSNDIAGTNYDWGVYNAISNGGNKAGMWRTLTKNEWEYLISTRTDATSKYAVAKVNNIVGVILLPDTWTLPDGLTFTSGVADDSGPEYYATMNSYTASEWAKMEANGAVFLPAAGSRNEADIYEVRYNGYYKSSSAGSAENAGLLYFRSNSVKVGIFGRSSGSSVRLVQDIE